MRAISHNWLHNWLPEILPSIWRAPSKCNIPFVALEGSYVFKEEHFVLKCLLVQIEQGEVVALCSGTPSLRWLT
jgi:hypothetical protein